MITYDDDDVENLKIADENWRYDSSTNAAGGNSSQLPLDEQLLLKEIMDMLGDKPLLCHQAHRLAQLPIFNTYRMEENEFTKNVEVVNRRDVPPGSNIISSHVL